MSGTDSGDDTEELGLLEGLRTTGAVREFQDRPVPDEVLSRVFDAARFAPNGGNQQAWHVVVVRDPALRRGVRDLYVPAWIEYLEQRADGVQPWAPVGDREAEAVALARAAERLPGGGDDPSIGDFARHFDEVPAMLVVTADLTMLAATDRDLGRYTLVGGASVYPFVWSVLLAARTEGLGGVMTTVAIRHEPELRTLLGIPSTQAVVAVLALGYPTKRATRLRRNPVDSFVTLDRFDGPAFRRPSE